jgi:hypothetical protein
MVLIEFKKLIIFRSYPIIYIYMCARAYIYIYMIYRCISVFSTSLRVVRRGRHVTVPLVSTGHGTQVPSHRPDGRSRARSTSRTKPGTLPREGNEQGQLTRPKLVWDTWWHSIILNRVWTPVDRSTSGSRGDLDRRFGPEPLLEQSRYHPVPHRVLADGRGPYLLAHLHDATIHLSPSVQSISAQINDKSIRVVIN